MKNIDGVLFIDTNQYIDLYRTHTGKQQLPGLKEQQEHIFVTEQVVDEVQRNKVMEAARFLAQNQTVNEQSILLTHALLDQITRSEDEVSKALEEHFATATHPTEDELQRARTRKELGNAPGKKNGPLGDQLNWEQILTRCQGKSKLWIITGDGDFATQFGGKMFLNAALYKDLARLFQPQPEVFCFNNIPEGLKHFADTTNVTADNLPKPEEIEQIKRERDALPPMGWLDHSMDDTNMVVILSHRQRQISPALWAYMPGQNNTEWLSKMVPAPDKTDK